MAGSGNVLSARVVRPARGVVAQPAGPRPAIGAVAVPGQEGPIGAAGQDGASGSALSLLAGMPLSGHRVVRTDGNGRLIYVSSLIPSDAGTAVGVTTGAADTDAPVAVNQIGDIVEPSWSFVPGPVWCGPDGQITQTVPLTGFVQQIGTALSPTHIAVAIGTPFLRA